MTDSQKNPKYWTTRKCEKCGNLFQGLISRNPRFCSNKCSAEFTANSSDRIRKIKATKLVKYGSETYVNPEKAKLTCLERYGVDNAAKTDDVKRKIVESNDYDHIAEVTRKRCRTEHGVEWVSNRADVKQRKIDTCRKNFGVDNPFQSNVVKEKIQETYKRKFGSFVDHPSKSNTIKQLKQIAYRNSFYQHLITHHRLNEQVVPLFSRDEYINTDRCHAYKFRCKTCGQVFEDHIDGGHIPRCLSCNPLMTGQSGIEQEIADYIKSMYVGVVEMDSRKVLPSGLELDVYLPEKKIAIEVDGLFWHSELAGKSKYYHLQKTEECEKLGIHLIHIFEDEWKMKSEIIKSKLSAMLCPSKRIGARKLKLRALPSADKNKFLDLHHIQGHDTCQLSVGAYLGAELVAVATFSKPRRALGHTKSEVGVYELSRFATSVPLVGVLPKMLKWLRLTTDCKKIVSYADRRFTSKDHNIYSSVGFSLIGETPVNYWYFRNGYFERFHRFGFIKSNLSKRLASFDPQKTEWQNMVDNGWNRIWDCGNLKYELTFDDSAV
jgi:hypothetical protein